MEMPAPVWFAIIVDTSAPLTINAQIAEQIKLLIAIGQLKSGDALPTVTQLAKQVGVNHNTIAAVYNYLTESGYLIAQRGKGTFVANTQVVQDIMTHKELYNLLGKAFRVATIAGLTLSEFAGAAYAQGVMQSQHTTNPLKLVFIDCLHNSSGAYEAIKSEIKQHLSFLSLEDLKAAQPKALKELLAADLVVTTGQHIWEVTELAAPEQEIIRVDIELDVQLLTQISSKPRDALILLVCQEETESEEMKQMLQQASVSHVRYQALGLENIKQNPQLLEQADVVCVSKKVEDYIRHCTSLASRVMAFNFSLNETNVSVLKARLSAIQLALATT
jgi:DNA-binding transcriptional regulator YhcF (GntR family)/galactitol-specific phosphotransferase system IIB component